MATKKRKNTRKPGKPVDPLNVKDLTKQAEDALASMDAPGQETIEAHCRRLGCFSPGEVAMLVKVGVTHAKVDRLAKAKGCTIGDASDVEETPLP